MYTHLNLSTGVRVTETELGDLDITLLETLLLEELLLVETDTTDELEGTLGSVAWDSSLALDGTRKATLRDGKDNGALLLVALAALGWDDHLEHVTEMLVHDTLRDIVGVLESLGSVGERHKGGELDHAAEGVVVVDRVLESLGASGNLLLHRNSEEGIARGALMEDVGKGTRHR